MSKDYPNPIVNAVVLLLIILCFVAIGWAVGYYQGFNDQSAGASSNIKVLPTPPKEGRKWKQSYGSVDL